MPLKPKYNKENMKPYFDRFKNGEHIKDLSVEMKLSKASVSKYFRSFFSDDPFYKKPSDAELIDCYLNKGMTGEQIRKKYNLYRDKLYLLFKQEGINFKMKLSYNDVKNGIDVDSINHDKTKIVRAYFENNHVENYKDLCDMFDVKKHYIYKMLKGCIPYRKSQKFYDLVVEDYKNLKTTDLVSKKHKIPKTVVREILRNNNVEYIDYRVLVEKKEKPKDQKPKRVRKKKVVEDKPKQERKLKLIKKTKKDVKSVKLKYELPKMQQGDVKVKKTEKILKTLPEEVRNKGYKLRIDSRTEIYVKDGVSPEVARERYLKRYSHNIKF